MKTAWHLLLLLFLSWSLHGCTFAPGSGWASVGAHISALLRLADPTPQEENAFVTNLDYPIQLDTLEFTVEGVGVYTSAAQGSQSSEFDPANPPAGYSLCHGGHCHTAEGQLETYQEIQAKLDRGDLAQNEQLHKKLPGQGTLNALEDQTMDIGFRQLGSVQLQNAAVWISQLRATGMVTIDTTQVPLWLTVSPESPAQVRPLQGTSGLPLELGPEGPETVLLAVEITETGTLFNDIRFHNLQRSGGAIIIDQQTTANAPILELVLAKLATQPVAIFTQQEQEP